MSKWNNLQNDDEYGKKSRRITIPLDTQENGWTFQSLGFAFSEDTHTTQISYPVYLYYY